jgi:hypothetical protein
MDTHRCLFCGLEVVDGREVSGFTGEGPDWMTKDGDFGCDNSPETSWNEDDEDGGCGSHAVTEEEARRAEISDEAIRVAERAAAKREQEARIRRAAPDMLATLERIAETPCDHGPQEFCPRELARAAIAKARGET